MWHSGRRQRLKSYINAPITQHLLGWSLVAILGLVLNGVGFFYWGYDYSLQSVGATAAEVKQLKQQVASQTQRIAQLEVQVAEAQQNMDIAQQSYHKNCSKIIKINWRAWLICKSKLWCISVCLVQKAVNTSLNIDSQSLRKNTTRSISICVVNSTIKTIKVKYGKSFSAYYWCS
jgi:cell division protein FtsB